MKKSAALLAVVVVALAARASAEPVVGEVRLAVPVGVTASLDVGYARGLQCDDVTIVRAELRADTPQSNRLYLTGLHTGVTQCRAGTLGPPTVLVTITVVPPR